MVFGFTQALLLRETDILTFIFYPPIFPNLKDCNLEFCNSASKLLVRAADITANRIYYHAVSKTTDDLKSIKNLHVITLPIETNQ